MKSKYTGADLLLDSLVYNGISVIFGYPGGANMPIYDSLSRKPELKHYLVRHEQGASFGAQGRARSTGKVGVCLATSGPGASNALTGIMDAYMDSVPLLFLTGQVPFGMLGKDLFQEMDTTGVSMSITKHNYILQSLEEIPYVVAEALHIATSGRPGPVHIDIPKDIASKNCTGPVKLIHYSDIKSTKKQLSVVSEKTLQDFCELLENSQKPVLLVGQGVKISGADLLVQEFVEKTGIPTTNTLLGKGAVPSQNENYLGGLGMHGTYQANMAVHNSDLIINIGSRFDDRIVGTYDSFAKNAKVIHIDIDKSELNKVVKTDLAINSDAKIFLSHLLNYRNFDTLQIDARRNQVISRKLEKPYQLNTHNFSARTVLKNIQNFASSDLENYIFVTDVGQHQMRAWQILDVVNSKFRLTSGGAGTMGFSIPTSMGASVAHPNKNVVVVVGDGGFQMSFQELQTIRENNMNIKILVLNNNFLGMVRQWQEMFFDKNYSFTPMNTPDFVKLGEAFGIKSYFCDSEDYLKEFLPEVFSQNGPCIVECKIFREDNVFPMVKPGSSLGETFCG